LLRVIDSKELYKRDSNDVANKCPFESRDLDEEVAELRRLGERFIMSHDRHVARRVAQSQRKKSSNRKR
jgi:hypothetical protein